jgi:hypothetical protein
MYKMTDIAQESFWWSEEMNKGIHYSLGRAQPKGDMEQEGKCG